MKAPYANAMRVGDVDRLHVMTDGSLRCGLRKLDSRGKVVFADESARAIAALDASRG